MKISSWNVNSVRARIDNVKNYLKYSKTDILMMQEIKTENTNFPFNDFKKMGFESYVHGQKKYNGIAILSKIKVKNVINDFINDEKKQSRILVSEIKNNSKIIVLINIYAPNGNPVNTDKYEYKKNWYKSFIQKIKKLYSKNNNIIIGGDFNVIPDKVDVYDYKKYENDALFKLEIRKKYRELINLGFNDAYRYFNKLKQEYTFWDYMSGSWQKNKGMRIDHFLVSNNLIDNIKTINIDKKPRAAIKPSDHTPIELEIN
tara:strand:- start:5534 stop:6310 length:777 start_codon:yes stop_codon:yes gene_type:complete